MRALAYAAIFGVGLMAAGVATADTWTDPAGRFTVDVPHGWRVQPLSSTGHTYIKIGNADHECQLVATPNSATATASPAAVRRAGADATQFTQNSWLRLANSITPVFPSNSAQFLSGTQDSGGGFWPLQRAELKSPNGVGNPPLPISTVHAGLTTRPGMDIMGFCYTISDPDYPTPDNPAAFDPVLRSLGTTNDATLQAAAEAADAAHAAAAAQAAQAPQQPAQQPAQQQQHRPDHREGPSLSHP
ncbi:MAG: hypothetical protein QM759_00080 [Terricaulis sp.]